MWTTSILPESCRLVVEETLPRGMYVDPDQLRDLRSMTGLKTYIPVAAGTVGEDYHQSFKGEAYTGCKMV